MHCVDPVDDVNVPDLQIEQAEDAPDIDEYLPIAHKMQLEDDDAPLIVRYRPTGHNVQVTDPVDAPYWPAGHVAHNVEPVADVYVLVGQFEQRDEKPVTELYVPAAHGVHSDEDAAPVDWRVVPALQETQVDIPDEGA